MNKPQGFSDLDAWNKFAGIQIKRAGVSHALLYTFTNFKKAVELDKCDKNKSITQALCLLFGVHTVLYSSASIYEGGFVLPKHNTSLLRLKQRLLQQIRPELIGILDSFLVSEGYIRSAFASGNPYDVILFLSRISYRWLENVR